jgi:flavin reductase (DIM6/NTAB) family NADH-FMN oxidoreductase RutF
MKPPTTTDIFNRVLDPALWVLTAAHGANKGGLVATFVANASLVPDLPRVIVGIARQHYTRTLIEASHCFALHLFDEGCLDWVTRFGFRSGRDGDKFVGLGIVHGMTGIPLPPAALTWLECRVEATLDTGDRTVYLAEVVQIGPLRPGRAMTLQRMLLSLPPEQLRLLDERLTRDILVDAEAIGAWRCSRGQRDRVAHHEPNPHADGTFRD